MKSEFFDRREFPAQRAYQYSSGGGTIDIWLEQNLVLGLWVAYVRRDGATLAVIMESDRGDVIATAQAMDSDCELLAA